MCERHQHTSNIAVFVAIDLCAEVSTGWINDDELHVTDLQSTFSQVSDVQIKLKHVNVCTLTRNALNDVHL